MYTVTKVTKSFKNQNSKHTKKYHTEPGKDRLGNKTQTSGMNVVQCNEQPVTEPIKDEEDTPE